MQKIDLRELSKMAKSFRASHKALKRIMEGEDFYVSFYGGFRRNGTEILLPDKDAGRAFLKLTLEGELQRLRKKFSEMGIDPLEIDGRKKKAASLKVAK